MWDCSAVLADSHVRDAGSETTHFMPRACIREVVLCQNWVHGSELKSQARGVDRAGRPLGANLVDDSLAVEVRAGAVVAGSAGLLPGHEPRATTCPLPARDGR